MGNNTNTPTTAVNNTNGLLSRFKEQSPSTSVSEQHLNNTSSDYFMEYQTPTRFQPAEPKKITSPGTKRDSMSSTPSANGLTPLSALDTWREVKSVS